MMLPALLPSQWQGILAKRKEVRLVRPRKVQSLCGALRHAGEPVALLVK